MSDSSAAAVSVVIPTYGHRDYVLQAIESVLGQTLRDFEIIVVNDGSPDDTADVLRPLVEQGRITYIEQANAGQAAARNRGIAAARGEFIALLDDDDVWPADHLQWQVEALRAEPGAVMVFGYYLPIGGLGDKTPPTDPPGERSLADFARASHLVSPGMALFRAGALREVGALDPTLAGTDDWDLYLRLSRAGKVLYQPRLALHYRVHASNASRKFWHMYRSGMRVVEKNFPAGSDPALRRLARTFIRQYAAQMGIRQALEAKRRGQRLAMMGALAKVFWIKPAIFDPRSLRRRLRTMMRPEWRAQTIAGRNA